MEFSIREFSEKDAKEICNWRYDNEYSIYNLPTFEIAKELGFGFTDELTRNREFKSLYNYDKLICYFRLVEKENEFTFGIGLKPNYCGKGHSKSIMPIILDYAKIYCNNKPIKLIVRNFNIRAIHVYKKFGFKELDLKSIKTPQGKAEFLTMIKS